MNQHGLSNMMYKNLVYKEYLDIPLDEMGDYLTDFLKLCAIRELEMKDIVIAKITQITLDQHINVTFYIPIENLHIPDEQVDFRSYLIIEEMLHGRIKNQNYEQEETQVIEEFNHFAYENDFKIISPYYHIINYHENFNWVDIKTKIMEME